MPIFYCKYGEYTERNQTVRVDLEVIYFNIENSNGVVILFWMRLEFEIMDLITIRMWVASSNLLKDWMEREKKVGGTKCWIFSCWIAWVGTSILPSHGAPGSQAFRAGLNHNTGFPESPVCKQWIVGLTGLHNYVIWFLIINLFMYISSCFSFSRELRLVQDSFSCRRPQRKIDKYQTAILQAWMGLETCPIICLSNPALEAPQFHSLQFKTTN